MNDDIITQEQYQKAVDNIKSGKLNAQDVYIIVRILDHYINIANKNIDNLAASTIVKLEGRDKAEWLANLLLEGTLEEKVAALTKLFNEAGSMAQRVELRTRDMTRDISEYGDWLKKIDTRLKALEVDKNK